MTVSRRIYNKKNNRACLIKPMQRYIFITSLSALLARSSGFSSFMLQRSRHDEFLTTVMETGGARREDVSFPAEVEAPGSDDRHPDMDGRILPFLRMSDDATRREAFREFVVDGMRDETNRSFDDASTAARGARDLAFVEDVAAALDRLGTVAQRDAWMRYFEAGFEAPERENALWTLVDMLIQFKMLVHSEDNEGLSSTDMSDSTCAKSVKCRGCRCASSQVWKSAPPK